MRISKLAMLGILLAGAAACNPPKPAETVAPPEKTTTATDPSATTNTVMPTTEPSNAVTDPTNGVVDPTDEPRGNPDRRDPPAGPGNPDRPPESTSEGPAEPK